jgi:hypothetical protein
VDPASVGLSISGSFSDPYVNTLKEKLNDLINALTRMP